MTDHIRNLNPHKPAKIAMVLYNERYAAYGGGSMDFWDSLTDNEKKLCRKILKDINSSPIETV